MSSPFPRERAEVLDRLGQRIAKNDTLRPAGMKHAAARVVEIRVDGMGTTMVTIAWLSDGTEFTMPAQSFKASSWVRDGVWTGDAKGGAK